MSVRRFFTEIASDVDTLDSGSHSLSFISDANVLALHRLLWINQERIGDYLSSSRCVVGDYLSSSRCVVGDYLSSNRCVVGDYLSSSRCVVGDYLSSSRCVIGDYLSSSRCVVGDYLLRDRRLPVEQQVRGR